MVDHSALELSEKQLVTFDSREDWLEWRANGIGGSEAAAVLGVPGAFGSRLKIWALKTGRMPPEDLSNNERVKWGTRLERAIIDGFAEETRRVCRSWSDCVGTHTAVVRHATAEWMFATPDGICQDVERGIGLIQVKTAHAGKLAEWSDDEPPLPYIVQVQHEMACTGAKWCALVCLVGGNALRWFDIERDEPFIRAMMAAEEAFWSMVRDGEMPEPDGSEQSGEALRAMFPRDSGAEIELPSEFIEIDERLLELKEQRKSLDRRIEGLEQAIKAAMGDAATARCGAAIYSWKTSQRKAYTVEASEVRRFSRKGL